MKCILVKFVRKLGEMGEVAKISPGYGRYLISSGYAVRYTKENQEIFKKKKKSVKKDSEMISKIQEDALSIEGRKISVLMQASSQGTLFGSVKKKFIAELLSKETGLDVVHQNVLIDESIKNIGVYPITISLYSNIEPKIILVVAQSEAESKALLDSYEKKQHSKKKDNS